MEALKDMMENLESNEQFDDLINGRVIFVFSAEWCPDCVFIKPFMKEIIKKSPQFEFYYVDRDQHLDLCKYLDIYGIPSFVAFNKGLEIGRFVSKNRKTKQEIIDFIKQLKV